MNTPRSTAPIRILNQSAPGYFRFFFPNASPQAYNTSVVSKRFLTIALASDRNPKGSVTKHDRHPSAKRRFSFSSNTQASKDFFPESQTNNIRLTKPAWPHPIYTEQQMRSINVAHREAKNWSDYIALTMVRILRWGLDFATGYKHEKEIVKAHTTSGEARPKKFTMTEQKYMIR